MENRKENQLYDITEVCKMLGTTSRTLRFYEEKGLITSTTPGISTRRQYTEEQLAHIRNVLVLRTLGLSVKVIAALQSEKADLKEAVLSKRAEIYASIDTRIREINLLNEALYTLESGQNLFIKDWPHASDASTREKEIARICTDAILNGDTDILYKYVSHRLAQYMPQDVYSVVRKDTFAPLGEFISTESITADELYPNKLYSRIRYSKLGLKITFVFHGGEVDGLWFGYCDPAER